MKKMNLGCGFDIKEGWINIDESVEVLNKYKYGEEVEGWNCKFPPPDFYRGVFDIILINHVLCTMSYDEAEAVLRHAYECLKWDGMIEIIDFDLLKAFRNYEKGDALGFFGFTGSMDERFCKSLVGYGRKSIYTKNLMTEMLERTGFLDIEYLAASENDLRPKESFILRGFKWQD